MVAVSQVTNRTGSWRYLSLSLRDRTFLFMVALHHGCRGEVVPYSRGEWPSPRDGKKGQRLLGCDSTVLQACELGLPCKVENRFESSVSRGIWGCLYPFATQSKKSIMTDKSCWVLVYSALMCCCFVSEMTFEKQIANLTWPCTLPEGWSVVWDPKPNGQDGDEW